MTRQVGNHPLGIFMRKPSAVFTAIRISIKEILAG